jgi:hypothetical protein
MNYYLVNLSCKVAFPLLFYKTGGTGFESSGISTQCLLIVGEVVTAVIRKGSS